MKPFPLNGVIGVVANNASEIDLAFDKELSCIEIRADLLLDGGHSLNEVLGMVSCASAKGLGCLFTLRHQSHGGKFHGSDKERVKINQAALETGADIIDLEWGSEAAEAMIKKGAPIIVSHHDFEGMIGAAELKELTFDMEACCPDAIKVVPTASTLVQSVQMLKWVGDSSDEILRIGFTMGLKGTCSRLLTMVYGAPITYASFGEAVAPGQLSIDSLLNLFQVLEINKGNRLYAVAGEDINNSPVLETMNQRMKMLHLKAICIPLETSDLEELLSLLDELRIDGVQLEDPLKHEALEKFPNNSLPSSASVFLKVSRGEEKREVHLLPISGEGFLEQIGK